MSSPTGADRLLENEVCLLTLEEKVDARERCSCGKGMGQLAMSFPIGHARQHSFSH